MENRGEFLIYETGDKQTQIEVKFEQDTLWLTQGQIVKLFQSSKANISEHTKHNFNHGELELKQTVRKFRTVRTEGKKQVSRELDYYNLDLNISVGYRVNYFIGALNSVLSTVVFNGIQFLPRISS